MRVKTPITLVFTAVIVGFVTLRIGLAFFLGRRSNRSTGRPRSYNPFDDQFVRILLANPRIEDAESADRDVQPADRGTSIPASVNVVRRPLLAPQRR